MIRKNKSTCSWEIEKFAKILPQGETTKKSAYKPASPQSVQLLALPLNFSMYLTNFQPSPARRTSPSLKDRLLHNTVVQITAGNERWKTFTSRSTIQTRILELRTIATPLKGAGMEETATSEGQTDHCLYRMKVFSTTSFVSRLHAREKIVMLPGP